MRILFAAIFLTMTLGYCGEFSTSDAMALGDFIMGKSELSQEQITTYDINADGILNVDDIVNMVPMIIQENAYGLRASIPIAHNYGEIGHPFVWNQSASQMAYYIMKVYTVGETIREISPADIEAIGGFRGNVCVGATSWDGEGDNLMIMGAETVIPTGYTENYMDPGEIPDFYARFLNGELYPAQVTVADFPENELLFPVETELSYHIHGHVPVDVFINTWGFSRAQVFAKISEVIE